MRPRTIALSVALAALAPAARAAVPGAPFRATRLDGRMQVDGRLSEPGWERAEVHDGFVQVFPAEGAAPSERTEVRVLYDDRALYVGVIAHDRTPNEVRRPMGRRDKPPYSDAITLVVDSMRDRRTAFVFTLSAAGVQEDGLITDGDTYSPDWDAVWDGAAATEPRGWAAEVRIPLSVLRFSDAPEQTWGLGVKRVIARRHEEVLSVLIPRNTRGQVARLNALTGLVHLEPVRALELTPYVAARVSAHPQDPDVATPRLVDPLLDVGLDLRASVGRGLSLQGAVNPDFGQVEADEIIQNLSTFEVFFPEKRPFFTQGMDLFQPVLTPYRRSPEGQQQLFYSRRVGLDAPILAAAKISGKALDALQVGIVDTIVSGAGSGWAASVETEPPRGFRFEPAQPFRFGPRSASPTLAPASRNLLAGVARWRAAPGLTLGASATSALLLERGCTFAENDLEDEVRPSRCDVLTGNAVAVDLNGRSPDEEWFYMGQLTGSHALGGAPERVLADGTVLGRGDLGYGGWVAAGRQGGEPWRFQLSWEYASPKLELNALGYLRTQNEQLGRAVLRYVRPTGGGPFHAYAFGVTADARLTTDGSRLSRGATALLVGEFQLRSFDWFGFELGGESERWDVREISEAGVPMRRPSSWSTAVWLQTDRSRPVSVELVGAAGQGFRLGPLAPSEFWSTSAIVSVRPHPRVETRVDARFDHQHWRARYVDVSADEHVFADLLAPALSLTLRQQVVLTPRLTLQAYAQLFTSYGHYGDFYAAPRTLDRVGPQDLVPRGRPTAASDPDLYNPDFREAALNVNVVLRWEYRLGSTLFLVYTRAQGETPWPDDFTAPLAPATLRPQDLDGGPASDTFLVKWSYFWSR